MSGPIDPLTPPTPLNGELDVIDALAPLIFSVFGVIALAVLLSISQPRRGKKFQRLDFFSSGALLLAVAAVFMLLYTFGKPDAWVRMLLDADGVERIFVGLPIGIGIAFVKVRSATIFGLAEFGVGLCCLGFGEPLATAVAGPILQLATFGAALLLIANGAHGVIPALRRIVTATE